jgi:hypothetical protein
MCSIEDTSVWCCQVISGFLNDISIVFFDIRRNRAPLFLLNCTVLRLAKG